MTSGADVARPDALKVFISYSRRDMAAADAMVADLERNGFAVTIDRRDLPYGEEWQKELASFIASSDTVVWLVSPDSVKSKWVNWELGEVGRLSKRLVPVRVRDVDAANLPEALGRIHLLPAEGAYEPAAHEAALVKALNTDRAWLKKATSLSDDAREWEAKGRDSALLLRGRALTEAEAWSLKTPKDAPAPPSDVLELILASRRGQRSRLRYTVIGSVAAAILAIGLSVYAFQQAQLASAKTVEATDGAARLAVNVAASLLDQGQSDAPAVLLLEAAKAFDDTSASDEMLIALHRVNQEFAGNRRHALPAGATAFDGPDALYFVDPARNAVLRFDGEGAPREIFADAAASPIIALGFLHGADATEVVISHRGGEVERIDALTGAVRFAGTMPPAGEHVFDTPREPEVTVHANGVITRNDFYEIAPMRTQTVGRILDTNNGAALTMELRIGLIYLIAADGSEIVLDGAGMYPERTAFARLARKGATIAPEAVAVSEDEFRALVYRTCAIDGGVDPAVATDAAFAALGAPTGEHHCVPIGSDRFLYTNVQSTSGGVVRGDTILAADGTSTNIETLLQGFGRRPSRANFSWLGYDAGRSEFGAIVNRELILFNDYQLNEVRSYPGPPGPAHFLAGGRLAMQQDWAQRVVASDLDRSPRAALDDPRQAAVVEGRERLTPLNPGSCTGFAFFDPYLTLTLTTADGDSIDYAGLFAEEGGRFFTISGGDGGPVTFRLPQETGCMQFSRDGRYMVGSQQYGDPIRIYDLRKARAGGTLESATVAAPGGNFSSAFFGTSSDELVTTDAQYVVTLWRRDAAGAWQPESIYEGDNPVFHAEPGPDLSRLLMIESLGAGDTRGFLQSAKAQQRWIDLGSDYKWFGVTFSADGAVASGARGIQRVLKLPTLSQLVAETEANLPAECKPTEPDDYRTSPCWPAAL
ncbi:MAG: toll/interleukin-1 receptor domain-containing protein [Rhizobiaceae bacterium]